MRASSSTHGIYQPTMIHTLMCSPTQLKTIPHSSADISMHEGSHCVYADATMWAGPLQHSCVASLWVGLLLEEEWSRQLQSAALWLLPRWPRTVHTRNCSGVFPASSSGTESLAGHHETQRPQAHGSYPVCHAWFEVPTKREKMISLENPGRNGSQGTAVCFTGPGMISPKGNASFQR